MGFSIEKAARPNILSLLPYRCARDDYKDGILLDANENAYGPSLAELREEEEDAELHRYPDPHQEELKQLMCNFRNSAIPETSEYTKLSPEEITPLTPKNLFLGVGSDECIDAVIRCFCAPGKEKMLTCPPTYGMYGVSATINDVEVVKVNLDFERPAFPIRPAAINEALNQDKSIKLAYICSPGNPTASLIDFADIKQILDNDSYNGLVIVDEAYIDFAPKGSSVAPLVNKYPNLIVMQTLSKSFGLAGIRLGITYASPEVAQLLNNLKAPYNISTLTAQVASRALSPEGLRAMEEKVEKIKQERDRLQIELPKIPGVGKMIGGTKSNFLLYQILSKPDGTPSNEIAEALYSTMAGRKGVVVRFRGKEPGCLGALRITVGTKEENDVLLKVMRETLEELYASKA